MCCTGSAGSSCDTPEEQDSRPRSERGAQRSTGVLVRQGAARVFPRLSIRGRSALRRRGADPYTVSFPPPARSPTSGRARPPRGGSSCEAHVPAEQPQARQDPRLSSPHAHQGRACRAARPPGSRAEASLGLIWRVRDRATFEALAGARRQRAGPVSLRHLSDGSDDPPRVAYAIGRRFGNAVERNRARRRLRAAVALECGELRPGGVYLFAADRSVMTLPFPTLRAHVTTLLRAVAEESR
jgi:ribonuclease P protein component